MNQIKNLSSKMLLAMFLTMNILMVVPQSTQAQPQSLEEVNKVLDKQDKPLKDLIDKIATWVLIAGGVVVLMIALFNKELARPTMITYLAVVIFWLIIKAIFF